MESIVFVGMDVHSNSFTLCCLQPRFGLEEDVFFGHTKMEPNVSQVSRYLSHMKANFSKKGQSVRFLCGYEAGAMGYALYHDFTKAGIDCVIIAPTSLPVYPANMVKTDKRDAERIARCLAYGSYMAVYVPDHQDEQVRDYIRLRDDHIAERKRTKQQITAFCHRIGAFYSLGRSKWTRQHLTWLRNVDLPALHREVLDEYLISLDLSNNRIDLFDQRIEELASQERYRESVKKLSCLIGVRTHTSLSILVEIGDFRRFRSADHLASYLGLTPGEQSSGASIRRTGLTKAGNRHVRSLLIESAHCIGRGQIGHKSNALKQRQAGNSTKVIAHADRANERLRRKFYRMTQKGKNHNVAIAAIARELACFIWALMTDRLEPRQVA